MPPPPSVLLPWLSPLPGGRLRQARSARLGPPGSVRPPRSSAQEQPSLATLPLGSRLFPGCHSSGIHPRRGLGTAAQPPGSRAPTLPVTWEAPPAPLPVLPWRSRLDSQPKGRAERAGCSLLGGQPGRGVSHRAQAERFPAQRAPRSPVARQRPPPPGPRPPRAPPTRRPARPRRWAASVRLSPALPCRGRRRGWRAPCGCGSW